MSDQEIYEQWLAAYENIDTRRITGYISADKADKLIRNMEERLGVNTWSVLRWHRAQNEWYKAEEGA
jgi:hypothetical protein